MLTSHFRRAFPGPITVAAIVACNNSTAPLAVVQSAAKVAFIAQPASATAGQELSPAVQVEIEDASGARVATAQNAVTLALGTNPGGALLSGVTTVSAVSGLATFTGVSITKAG